MPPQPRRSLLVLLSALLAGCSAAPAPTASGTATPEPPPAASATPNQPGYATLQAALADRSAAAAALTGRPVGKRDWATISAGFLPAAEKYEDRRRKAMKEKAARSEYGLESVLGWTSDGSTVVVSEYAGSGADYRIAVYRWNAGRPLQLFQLPVSPLSRVRPAANAVAETAPASATAGLVSYRTKGTKPAKVLLGGEADFVRFTPTIDKKHARYFTETNRCSVPEAFGAPVAWRVPTDSGTLTLAAVRCLNKIVSKGGWQVKRPDWDQAITGDKRYFDRLSCDDVFPMAASAVTGGNTSWHSPQQQPLTVCTTG